MFLNQYSDFVTEIISNSGTWPDGCSMQFQFQAPNSLAITTWAATVSGATASWDVAASDVAALLATGVSVYRLFYLINSSEVEWSKGPIVNVS